MMRDNYREICEGINIRSNLAALRSELTDEYSLRDFEKITGGDQRVLLSLLDHTDPKVRKNACSVIGACRPAHAQGLLWHKYCSEKTLFVRPSYLKALSCYDCLDLVPEMKEQERILMTMETAEEERKHRLEELAALRAIIQQYAESRKHVFRFAEGASDVVLITNRCQREATKEQISMGDVRLLAGGMRVSGGNLHEIAQIRTVEEILFPVPKCPRLAGTAEEIGTALAGSGMLVFLDRMHEPDPELPYAFRIDLRGQIPADKKGSFIRRISDVLERKTNARMRGSASDYELELRLLQRKDSSYIPFLKLHTFPDERFSYRTGQTSESISPVNAALTIWLARPWLKEGAQVLDPFCGVGTMLIERTKAGNTGMLFGVDIYADAVRLGRENAQKAGTQLFLINRDFLTFEHDHPFDEVISDLPRHCRDEETGEIVTPEKLYRQFFEKLPSLLKEQAVLVLYTPLGDLIESCVQENSCFSVEKIFPVNERNQTAVYVLKYQKL